MIKQKTTNSKKSVEYLILGKGERKRFEYLLENPENKHKLAIMYTVNMNSAHEHAIVAT
jgi:hypothetical protein